MSLWSSSTLIVVLVAFLVAIILSFFDFPSLEEHTEFGDVPHWNTFQIAVFFHKHPLISKLKWFFENSRPPAVRIAEMSSFFVQSRLLFTVVELGIADALPSDCISSQSTQNLANQLQFNDSSSSSLTSSEMLCRLLGTLASLGFFEQVAADRCRFRNNKASLTLRRDHPSRMWAYVLQMQRYDQNSFGDLTEMIRDHGKFANRGRQFWERLSGNQEDQAIFSKSLLSTSLVTDAAVVRDVPLFTQIHSIADIGGGIGGLLMQILQFHSNIEFGLLIDHPSVIALAKEEWNHSFSHLIDRVRFVGGDFFKLEEVPQLSHRRVDAFVLRAVLHDWEDKDAIRILTSIHRVATQQHQLNSSEKDAPSRLLLVELVLEDERPSTDSQLMDMLVMTVVGGRQRTRTEFEQILSKAGFSLIGVHRTRSMMSVLEAVPMTTTAATKIPR